ncbi:MAG: thioredoxin family protein, partial [Solirubrobacterales bacterium]
MSKASKIGVVAGLILAITAVVLLKQRGQKEAPMKSLASPAAAASQAPTLPRLVDLGRETCIPCKMMIPVLAQLREEYAGRLSVEFVNTEENPAEADKYNIKLIPTQVFIDASGKELFRHEGFFSKEDIVAKWKELGVDLSGPSSQAPAFERLTPAQPDARPKDTVC